ncbi:MAG: hypothetical protein U0165_12105 [Polyangiaceae bacterium]
MAPAIAIAQPKLPDPPKAPDLPKPPATPAPPAISAPSLPAVPSGAPALPSGAPGAPNAPAKPGAPAPAAPGAPAPDASAGSSAPSNATYVLYGKDKKKDDSDTSVGVPPTLPPELRKNVAPGTAVGDNSSRALTIEEIVNTPVISASNQSESANAAPALVIVLTAKDIMTVATQSCPVTRRIR